jgi:hypothetical protein
LVEVESWCLGRAVMSKLLGIRLSTLLGNVVNRRPEISELAIKDVLVFTKPSPDTVGGMQ